MTNELAKMLKDAGFPQHGAKNAPYVPNLGELIAECGNRFWSLRRTPDGKWIAAGHLTQNSSKIPYYESTSYDEPDTAAAELFLSIKVHEHEKDSNNK